MKTKRFVSTLLALLLVCSLPASAFAMGNNPAGTTVTEIRTGEVMTTNNGTVTTNNGTVSTNNGTVTDNYYLVRSNYGTVSNNGTEENNDYASVSKNYGTITTNEGNVDYNYGTVTTNNGTVFKNGTEANHDKAIVETNNFRVGTNNGTVTTNNGTVSANIGTVDTNEEKGIVDVNFGSGAVETNKGTVNDNNGTVSTNSGTVTTNYGTVDTNYGTVDTNYNTVFKNGTETNHDKAIVETNNHHVDKNFGTVGTNNGTVDTNEITGTVTNKNNGTVGTNYGTVNEADGTTHYGVQVDNDGDVSLAQKEKGETWDLAQLFTKAGYVLTGFIQAYQAGENGLTQASTTVEGTSYTADCPNVLTLIWQAIVNPAADDGAGSFGPGSVISINGHKFLLVAVVEDVYCLASVDSFEDEQLSDLPALLASLLTEEQLSHVTGEPELLDEALTARFFAGEGSHIVFPCDSSLIFS